MRQIIVVAGLLFIFAGVFVRFADKAVSERPAPTAMMATPEPEVSASGRTVVITQDKRGHFQVNARVDGKQMGFMVDTGASVIALMAADARRLGLRPSQREFTATVQTANGTVHAAPTQLDRVEIDGVTVRNVAALIMPDEVMGENLLGLSFLSRLRRFEYANGKLVLEQ